MAILDLFSKQEKRRQRQGQEDVLRYDELPQSLRVQICHIWSGALGVWLDDASNYRPNKWWHDIHQALAREKGVFQLSECGRSPDDKVLRYFLEASTEDALDVIHVTFLWMDHFVRHLSYNERHFFHLIQDPDEAIDELNRRFLEHCVGYEFTRGKIIRIDSKYLHAETVKPALQLLYGAGSSFSGPLEEFLKAHQHHRNGEQKEAIANAAKAFESTLKAICTARGWAFDANRDNARELIEKVFTNELIPAYLQNHFNALRSVLESGVPTVRNRTSGHGQGATPTAVPDWFASYVLHLTAANIVMLIQANAAK